LDAILPAVSTPAVASAPLRPREKSRRKQSVAGNAAAAGVSVMSCNSSLSISGGPTPDLSPIFRVWRWFGNSRRRLVSANHSCGSRVTSARSDAILTPGQDQLEILQLPACADRAPTSPPLEDIACGQGPKKTSRSKNAERRSPLDH
jgi:hypothetical protein